MVARDPCGDFDERVNRMDVYLYLSSLDSKSIHGTNVPGDFTVELPQQIYLPGLWECALVDFQLTGSPPEIDPFCICSNVCQESCVGDVRLPILRRMSFKGRTREAVFQFEQPHYIRVKVDLLERVRIFITDPHHQGSSVSSGQVTCTLHLRRRQ